MILFKITYDECTTFYVRAKTGTAAERLVASRYPSEISGNYTIKRIKNGVLEWLDVDTNKVYRKYIKTLLKNKLERIICTSLG